MIFKNRLFSFILGFFLFSAFWSPNSLGNSAFEGLSLSEKKIRDLIRQFGPIIYFHPKEKYFPESVELFADKAYIECFTEQKKGKKIKRTSTAKYTSDIRKNLSSLPNNGRSCVFALPKSVKKLGGLRGAPLTSDGKIRVPSYVHVFELRPDYYILQFVFFYAHNGPTIGRGKLALGDHEGDWEHMDVHVRKHKKEWGISRVHYAAHQQFRGGMYKPGEFPKMGTHPIAYAAKYGHASLPRETRLDENLDTTKKSKYVWNCGSHYKIFAINGVPLNSEAWWVKFSGRWGNTREGFNNVTSNSPDGPYYARWFREKVPHGTTNKRTYNLIDNPDAGLNGGVRMLRKPKKGTRPFIFESPSRLNHNFCVEFFMEDGKELIPWATSVPPFKISHSEYFGLKKKTLYRSENSFEITKDKKYGKKYRYCFKRPKKTQIKGTFISWKGKEVPISDLVVKLTGFEF
ncbi:Vps62-related protein [Alphaproteobacteria bacterium]|nr:Vps62-related protein [Alphaproteobacteria bacterium]